MKHDPLWIRSERERSSFSTANAVLMKYCGVSSNPSAVVETAKVAIQTNRVPAKSCHAIIIQTSLESQSEIEALDPSERQFALVSPEVHL